MESIIVVYQIKNETGDFLTNTGVWSSDFTEAMQFNTRIEAATLIEKMTNVLPAFVDLFPEVVLAKWNGRLFN